MEKMVQYWKDRVEIGDNEFDPELDPAEGLGEK